METPLDRKSTVGMIRERFDADVERFSNLETGQAATIDAPLAMELITRAAAAATPGAKRILDIGCGAGNNAIKLVREFQRPIDCDLCDLSLPMLTRARERLAQENAGAIRIFHGDFREMPDETETYDVIVAAAVLHHLREDADWEQTFQKIHRILVPGGSFWITDLVTHEAPAIDRLMWSRYEAYLTGLGGTEYAAKVLAYIDQEDSPRPVTYQLDLLRRVGFQTVDLLHKNSCFAAFGGVKAT